MYTDCVLFWQGSMTAADKQDANMKIKFYAKNYGR